MLKSQEDNDELAKKSKSPQEKLLEPNKKLETQSSIPEEYTRCGFGWFHPKWLQVLNSKKSFVIVYALAGMLMFALSTYFIGILSTLEKSYKMSSSMSGIITASWDAGGLMTNILITYIASKGHRTRWLAAGMFITGLTCFARVIPYLLYGPGEDAKTYTLEYSASNHTDAAISIVGNYTLPTRNVQCSKSGSANMISFYIFLVSHILVGMGTSIYWTCGAAYLDDNARKNIVPVLLAAVQMIRLLGPTVGSLLSSYSLGIYVDPSLTPSITSKDPRWIGAWWMGWYPIGIACIILSVLLMLFPRVLRRAAIRRKDMPVKKGEPSLSDFKKSVHRLVRNKVLVFNSLSSVFFMIGLMAYWIYTPKYMETQFRISASRSNFITGTVGILSNALGVMVAGVVISKFKPRPRVLAGWNVLSEFMDVAGHIIYTFLSCPDQKIHGQWSENGSWSLNTECNQQFSCGANVQYTPVCDTQNGLLFYSPCSAGCSYSTIINGMKAYGGCSCVPNNGTVIEGTCPADCSSNIIIYVIIMAINSFTTATGKSSNMLIQFRCVAEEDKSLSIGITEALLSLLAFIPSPLLYGVIMDATCQIWGNDCGKRGNCWFYQGKLQRYVFNLSASGFLLIGAILDIFVWYYSKDLKIYDEDFTENSEPTEKDAMLKN